VITAHPFASSSSTFGAPSCRIAAAFVSSDLRSAGSWMCGTGAGGEKMEIINQPVVVKKT
jgi:hypothetical protein